MITQTDNTLRISSPDGKHCIDLIADNTGAGIWFTNKVNDRLVSIYNFNDQIAIGIYHKMKQGKMNIALSVDDDGNPEIQFIDNEGNVKHFTIGDLR